MDNTKITFYGDGEFWIDGKKRAKLYSDGDLYVDGKPAGKVYSDGDVYLWNKKVGKVYPDGDFYVNGKCVLKGVRILDYLKASSNTSSISSTKTEETKQTFSNTPTTTPTIPSLNFSSLGCFGIFFAILILIAFAIGWITEIPGILLDTMKTSAIGPLSIILIYGSMLYSIYAQWELGSRKGNSSFDYGVIRQSLSFLIITAVLLFIDRLLLGIQYHATFNQIVSSFFSAFGINSIWSLLSALLACLLLGCPPAIVGSLITSTYLKVKGPRTNTPKTKSIELRPLGTTKNIKSAISSRSAQKVAVPKPVVVTPAHPNPVTNTHYNSSPYHDGLVILTFLGWILALSLMLPAWFVLSHELQMFASEDILILSFLICTVLVSIYFITKRKTSSITFWGYLLRFFMIYFSIPFVSSLIFSPYGIRYCFDILLLFPENYFPLIFSAPLCASIFPALLCWRVSRKK